MYKRVSFLVILVLILNIGFAVFAENSTQEPTVSNEVTNNTTTETAIITPEATQTKTSTEPAAGTDIPDNSNKTKVMVTNELPDGFTITGGVKGQDWDVINEGTRILLYVTGSGLTFEGTADALLGFEVHFNKNSEIEFTLKNFDAPNTYISLHYESDLNIILDGENHLRGLDITPTHFIKNNLTFTGINNSKLILNLQLYTNSGGNNSNISFKDIEFVTPTFEILCTTMEISNCIIETNKFRLMAYASTHPSTPMHTNSVNNVNISDSYIESSSTSEIRAWGNINLSGVSGTFDNKPSPPVPPVGPLLVNPSSIPSGASLYTYAVLGANNAINIQVDKGDKLIVNQEFVSNDTFMLLGVYAGNGINIDQGNTIVDSDGNGVYYNEIQLKLDPYTQQDPSSALTVTDDSGNPVNTFEILGDVTPQDDDEGKNIPIKKTSVKNTKTNAPITSDDSSLSLWLFMAMVSLVTISEAKRKSHNRT